MYTNIFLRTNIDILLLFLLFNFLQELVQYNSFFSDLFD